MRITAFLAGLLLSALIFANNSSEVQALTPADMALNQSPSVVDELILAHAQQVAVKETEAKPKKPAVVKHVVKADETLTDVAKQHDTTWQRVYAKNKQLEHPDIIAPEQELIIPAPEEDLEMRELPATEAPAEATLASTDSNGTYSQPTMARGASSGNLYSYGYCTWYVKNQRPDLPNNLGNANTWVSRASAQGYSTGSTPRVGAVGQQGMHVVYVQSVNGDGTVTVSEMNFRGWNVVSTRTVAASSFMYIY